MTWRELLWKYGHGYCPANYKSGDILRESAFLVAPQTHPAMIGAIRSYQEWFRDDLDRLAYRCAADGGYKRAIICDGDIGPLTEQVLNYARCGWPDYLPASAEQGNWPESCRQEIRIKRNFDKLPGTDVARTDSVFDTAASNWNSALDVHIMPDQDAVHPRGEISLANLPGSVLADQYLANGDCSYTSQGRMDRRDWSQEGFPAATTTHEWLHFL